MRELPSTTELRKELSREIVRSHIRKKALLIAMILLGFLFMVVIFNMSFAYKVKDSDMSPTLNEKDILIMKGKKDYGSGDLVVLEYEDQKIVRRIVAAGNDWIDFDRNGNVYVNNKLLEESYVDEKSLGNCDIDLPYQIPEGQFFVLADERLEAMDSRKKAFGCIDADEIEGKIVLRIWPMKNITLFGREKDSQTEKNND
ncbi:MAG: signal peptidase I [Erysipelotrichaceae bacterium]|nr:signal peptidase I [Erysipelotrichaceae bacterium]